MKYWLVKSEPGEVSIDHLAAMPQQTVPWFGVRNYQARNFMMNEMSPGDGVLFYHSSCPEPGIAGLAEVASSAYPDQSQFEVGGHYYDAKASPEKPRWFNVDVRLVRKTRLVSLAELRAQPQLAAMPLLARGNRLSITPVSAVEWTFITRNLLK
jgi:predicted RNA-binding protein with PUA-like domain